MRASTLLLFLLFAFVILPICVALAAEPGSTVVNVSPLVDWGLALLNEVLVPLLLAVAVAVLTWLGSLAKKMVGTNNERGKAEIDRAIVAMNSMLHAGIQRGVDALEGMTREKLFKDGKPVTINLHSEAVAWVANRMIEYSPDLLKKLGVSTDRLKELALEAIVRKQDSGLVTIEGLGSSIDLPATVGSPAA